MRKQQGRQLHRAAHEADRRSDREAGHREMHALGDAFARVEKIAQGGAREEEVAFHNMEM